MKASACLFLIIFKEIYCQVSKDDFHIVVDSSNGAHVLTSGTKVSEFVGAIREKFGMSHRKNQECINRAFKPSSSCGNVHNVFFSKYESTAFRDKFPQLNTSTITFKLDKNSISNVLVKPRVQTDPAYNCDQYCSESDGTCQTTFTTTETYSIARTTSSEFGVGVEVGASVGVEGIASASVKVSTSYKFGAENEVKNESSRTVARAHTSNVKAGSLISIIPKTTFMDIFFEVTYEHFFKGYMVFSYEDKCAGHYYYAMPLVIFLRECYPKSITQVFKDKFELNNFESFTTTTISIPKPPSVECVKT